MSTFAEVAEAIEKARNFAVEGWTLTDKEAQQGAVWLQFLEGIGAERPKIGGFDGGLLLVWRRAGFAYYLTLHEDDTAGVLVFDDTRMREAQQAKQQ